MQWITLFSETFIWKKRHEGYVYNSKNFKGFHFNLNNRLSEICKELMIPENLYSTLLNKEDLRDVEIQNWIHTLINVCEAGFLTSGETTRPVSFIPILKIIDNVDYYIWEHQQGFGGDVMRNLHELTFYINSSENGNNNYFKQLMYPLKNSSVLDFKNMVSFIRYSQNPYLTSINFVGNIFCYSHHHELVKEIGCLDIPSNFYFIYQDFVDNIMTIKSNTYPDNFKFNVVIDLSNSICPMLLHEFEIPIDVTICVFSEEQFYIFQNDYADLPIYCDATVVPIYNKYNLHFFEKYVFIKKDDLNKTSLSKRDILMRQIINTNDFGKLTIFPDGKVYANVNMNHLGILEDSVYSIVYKEITKGRSWRRIRNMMPCNNCIFQWICPSPSNYELVINKPNLCKLVK